MPMCKKLTSEKQGDCNKNSSYKIRYSRMDKVKFVEDSL